MSRVNLISDFNAAAGRFREDMLHLQDFVLRPEGQNFLKTIPLWSPEEWKSINNRCYNFALNRKTPYSIQPGALSGLHPTGKMREDYVASLHDCALMDGLVFLGEDFRQVAPIGNPVALFIRPIGDMARDHHWIALRRTEENKLVWAHKQGQGPAALLPDNIFQSDMAEKYRMFAGYYAEPGHSP